MTYLTSVANGVADGGSTTHDSSSLTVSGTNKVMWVLVANSDSTPATPSGVVWDPAGGAQALTMLGSAITFATYGNTSLWRLIAPSNATGVVRATWAAAKGERAIVVWVETDVSQATPNGTLASATGSAATVSAGAVTTSVGQRVLNFGHAMNTGVFGGAGVFGSPTGTERQDTNTTGTAYDAVAAQEQTASGTSTTPTWSIAGGFDGWTSWAFAVNAATGGGGYTLTADGGSFTVTGAAAGLKQGYKLVAAGGSYTLTGADALRDFSMVAAGGSFALTGANAGLSHGYRLTASGGSFGLTGAAAALRAGRNMAASGGSFLLTGIAAALRHGYILTAAGGSYTLTGAAAGLKAARVIPAAGGTFTLTGADATLTHDAAGAYTLTAEGGSFVLTGAEAALTADRVIAAAGGVFTLTGASAGLSAGRKLAVDPGSFALTGADATLTYDASNPTIAADGGSYVVSGGDATLTYSGAVRTATTKPGRSTRNYIIKGKRYFNLTNEELAYLLARDMIDAQRTDVKVTFKNKKPHAVSKASWESLKTYADQLNAPLEVFNDDEEAAMLLL